MSEKNKPAPTALTELESKQFLKPYGVPVVNEILAPTVAQAVKAAQTIGFPVVLKGLGKELLHKTELQLVHLNLNDAAAVETAAGTIEKNAGAKLEGFLVQPQMAGKREFVAGMFRDDQYGPVVMFGLGGIFTEALADVCFRLAPLTVQDAEEMITGIKSKKLLGPFRGEPAVDMELLVRALMGLSKVAVECPDVSEIDINPLLITPEGKPVAVDALIIKNAPKPLKTFTPPVSPADVAPLFYPRSVAFVGASGRLGKWGYTLLTNTIGGGFSGEIYLVNPKGGTIAGRPVYTSVLDIPGPVDVAVVTIPAEAVPALIPEFKKKGIANMLLIASGFAETGGDGIKKEKELIDQARAAGIRIIGPNTMGICNPHINFYCTGTHVRPTAGSTSVVAQSGNMGNQLLAFAELQGIGIRAFCGSGNEGMITIEDYLDAFEVDPLTETVMLYIESVKNGRRFFKSARRVGKKKPIILLKGGQTEAGSKAAASHTGALSSDNRVFNAVCRQAGIVKVERPMELLDLSAAFSSLPLPKGKRVAIMTLGGGWGVVTADLCEAHGLDVPELSEDIIKQIDEILPPYWSRANPIDLVGENDLSIPMTTMEALMKWDGCDAIINLGIVGRRHLMSRLADSLRLADPTCPEDFLGKVNQALDDFEEKYIHHIVSLMSVYQKPVLGVSMLKGEKDLTVTQVKGFRYKGLFFPTPEQAVLSLAKMYEYQKFINRENGSSY
ncbi:MAG: acetate--CoA ligase family protein [Desulfosalsimonadaceae bacterium]